MKKNIFIQSFICASLTQATLFSMENPNSSESIEIISSKHTVSEKQPTQRTVELQHTRQMLTAEVNDLNHKLQNLHNEYNNLSQNIPHLASERDTLNIQKGCLESAINAGSFQRKPVSQKIAKKNELTQVTQRLHELHHAIERHATLPPQIENLNNEIAQHNQHIHAISEDIDRMSQTKEDPSQHIQKIETDLKTKLQVSEDTDLKTKLQVSEDSEDSITKIPFSPNTIKTKPDLTVIEQKINHIRHERSQAHNHLLHLEQTKNDIPHLESERNTLNIKKGCLESAINAGSFQRKPVSQKEAKKHELAQVTQRLHDINQTILQHQTPTPEIQNLNNKIAQYDQDLNHLQADFDDALSSYIDQSIQTLDLNQNIQVTSRTIRNENVVTLNVGEHYEESKASLPIVWFQTYNQNTVVRAAAKVEKFFHSSFNIPCDEYYIVLQHTNDGQYKQMITPHGLMFPDAPCMGNNAYSESKNTHVEIFNAQAQPIYQGNCSVHSHNDGANTAMRFSPDHRPSIDFHPGTIFYSIVQHDNKKIATLHYNMRDDQITGQELHQKFADIALYKDLVQFLQTVKVPSFMVYSILQTYNT